MTPAMETRIYEAVSRLNEQVSNLEKRVDERHRENREDWASTTEKVDEIMSNKNMFPYETIKHNTENIIRISGMLDKIFIGMFIVGGIGLSVGFIKYVFL